MANRAEAVRDFEARESELKPLEGRCVGFVIGDVELGQRMRLFQISNS